MLLKTLFFSISNQFYPIFNASSAGADLQSVPFTIKSSTNYKFKRAVNYNLSSLTLHTLPVSR